MIWKSRRPGAVTLLAMGMATSPALAGADETGKDEWSFNLVPYVWAAGAEGSLSHRALPRGVEAGLGFRDIFERLDVGGMLAFEARRGRTGILLDALYVSLSDEGRLPVIGLPVDAGARTFTGLAAIQHRAVDQGRGSLDLLAGVRLWSVESRLSWNLPAGAPLPPGIPATYSGKESATWADAMAGAKASVRLSSGFSLNAMAMFGGGGSGFSSDAMLSLGVAVTPGTSLLAGYRHLNTSYRSDSGYSFDTSLHGPAIGVGLRF